VYHRRPVLELSCDLSRLDMKRPSGAAVYAGYILDQLAAGGQVRLQEGSRAGRRRPDLTLNVDGRFRPGRGERVVTVVLDLGHLYARQAYSPLEWMRQNWRVASAARRSHHLLVASAAVQGGLETYLKVPTGRITVFAPLPRPEFKRPPRAEFDELRRRLGLPDRYFVFVGARSRRKNLRFLGESVRAATGVEGAVLVLAGPGRGGTPGARDLGYVALQDLPGLIAGALAWVNPSHYEGSSIGALEAMACGTPVLVSATGAQARDVGLSGLVLPPGDIRAWAEALTAVAGDRNLRGRLSAAGLRRVAELRASASPTQEVLAALSGRGSP
jgi:glycosyltransferase involved in cell wall biosynthesis